MVFRVAFAFICLCVSQGPDRDGRVRCGVLWGDLDPELDEFIEIVVDFNEKGVRPYCVSVDIPGDGSVAFFKHMLAMRTRLHATLMHVFSEGCELNDTMILTRSVAQTVHIMYSEFAIPTKLHKAPQKNLGMHRRPRAERQLSYSNEAPQPNGAGPFFIQIHAGCLLFVVCCLLFVAYCVLFVVGCVSFVVCRVLSVVCSLLFVDCCRLPFVCCLLLVVFCWLCIVFFVCCLLSVVCCLLFVDCGWLIVVCCVLFVLCSLLFVVCCLLCVVRCALCVVCCLL